MANVADLPATPKNGDLIIARTRMKTGEKTYSFFVSWVETARDGNGWYVGMQPSYRADSMTASFGATNLRVTPKEFGVVDWAIVAR